MGGGTRLVWNILGANFVTRRAGDVISTPRMEEGGWGKTSFAYVLGM
jgi:hypothetical protein